MGMRGNLVLVHEEGYDLYYCHWCASTLPRTIFWGPRFAEIFIKDQKPADKESGWLDTIWSEGGVVMNPLKKEVLLYGGEDLQYNIAMRRLFLELMGIVWRGWSVQWANGGIVEMATYLDVPKEVVITKVPIDEPVKKGEKAKKELIEIFKPRKKIISLEIVASILFSDGRLAIFPTTLAFHPLKTMLNYGPHLLDVLRELEAPDRFSLSDVKLDEGVSPGSGIHIDEKGKKLTFWMEHAWYIEDVLAEKWPDWEYEFVGDRYEVQEALTDQRLDLSLPENEHDLLADLAGILLKESDHDPIKGIQLLFQKLDEEGQEVTAVNPNLWDYNPLTLNIEVKREIFERALMAWRANKSKA